MPPSNTVPSQNSIIITTMCTSSASKTRSELRNSGLFPLQPKKNVYIPQAIHLTYPEWKSSCTDELRNTKTDRMTT